LGVSSCSENDTDNLKLTGEEGRPKSFRFNNGDYYLLTYDGSRLLTRIDKKGRTYTYKYNDDGFYYYSAVMAPEEGGEGGAIRFEKESKNKIIVQDGLQPDMLYDFLEIDLDESEVPVRITHNGVYCCLGIENPDLLQEGSYYFKIKVDPETKNLLKTEKISKKDSKILETITYEYDDKYGTMSGIDLPIWFRIYYSVRFRSSDPINKQILNYHNNIVKQTVSESDKEDKITKYIYTYDEKGFPLSALAEDTERGKIIIEY